MFANTVVVFLVMLSAGAVALHSLRFKPSPYLHVLLGILAVFSVWFYTDYGKLHWVKKNDPLFIEHNNGSSDKRTYFHWHEIYHYYLGAKYYPELNNHGLYEAVALADHESPEPYIQVPRVRDLSNKLQSITIERARERAETIYKPRFTPERWKEFSDDLAYMKSIAPREWLDLGMYDAGFNPTPAWCVIGTPLANLISITPKSESLPIWWDKAELLPFIDLFLLVLSLGFVAYTFGLIPALLFVIVFGTSFLASQHWIAGSFLRYPWLAAIIIGVCMMKKERWLTAGMLMGFSAAMLVFPAVFAVGGAVALLWRVYQKKKGAREQLIRYSIGGASVVVILFVLSLLMFGWDYWKIFFGQIGIHRNMFYVWHIGYRRIAVWDSWVPNQSFWWSEGLSNFTSWNAKLNMKWDAQQWYQIPIMCSILAAATWASRKLRAEETTLLIGGLLLFFFAIPANYYYVYFTLIPVVFFAVHRGARERALLAAFLLLWFVIYLLPNFSNDDLVKNYLICIALMFFFLFWVGIRFFDEDSRLSAYLAKTFNAR